jgi:hypothetical protein
MKNIVRIGGAQGFYGDSPMGAAAMLMEGAVDYLMHDALAELTLSILQKDRQKDPSMGYARDIEFHAKMLYPAALAQGVRIVSNAGGLNPRAAAERLRTVLAQQGLSPKIAIVYGDDILERLSQLQAEGELLLNMDSGKTFAECPYPAVSANVYLGAQPIKDALDLGADIVLAGRVADPALCLGILAHEFGWDLDDPAHLDRLANGIMIGHILECGGQASGGNSYAEWPPRYTMGDLGYPIAHVAPDGSATITKLESQGGTVTRNTVREQLVYEIHDPARYLTPDVTVDFTGIRVEEIGPDRVAVGGARGLPRPERLKAAIVVMEGYLSEQMFFFSWPYAYEKAQAFEKAAREIWDRLPLGIERIEANYLGINGIHGSAAPMPPPERLAEMNEVGLRLAFRHADAKTGRLALQAITCLGLNGPPGITANPNWGKDGRTLLSLWPALVHRDRITAVVETV